MIARVKQYIFSSYSLLLKVLPTKRMRIFALILFFAVTTSGILVATLPAAAFGVSTVVNGIITGIVYLLLLLATLFIQITIFFLKFFILIAGYNNYINAPVVLLGWNMIRDVANMFFVVILLVIAFSTILGLEQYEWRKALVKLVLAAILVNFSNLILQLIIDVAQVFMITFLNAVAGAAGGNLINMFNLDKILNLSVGNNPEGDKIQLELMAAGVMALVFAAVAMFTMFAYIVVLLYRVVLLWVSIILSPLAFLFSVLPQTKSYADEFWKEFTNHVIAGPMMVFFLWLAFATFGGGGITQHLEQGNPIPSAKISTANSVEDISGKKPGASINEAASWENMANFIVAIAFLWIGIERVQKLGVRGGGLTAGAIDFGKKVATIASGYAVGRWLVGKGADAGKFAAYHAPLVGGEKWEKRAKVIGEAATGWYYGKGTNMTPKGEEIRDGILQKLEARAVATPQGKAELAAQITDLEIKKRDAAASFEKQRAELIEKTPEGAERDAALAQFDTNRLAQMESLDTSIADAKKLEAVASVKTVEEWDKEIAQDEKLLQKELGGGIVGAMARSNMKLDKQMRKTAEQTEYRKKLLSKRTGSESGGVILGGLIQFGMGAEKAKFLGIPLGKYFSDPYAGTGVDQARRERGWYQAEEARGAAKDAQFETQGRLEGLKNPRLKFNVDTGKVRFEFGSSVAERIEGHKSAAEAFDSEIKLLELSAREKLLAKSEKQMANIDNAPEVKGVKDSLKKFESETARLRRTIENLNAIQKAQLAQEQFNQFNKDAYKNQLRKDNPDFKEADLNQLAEDQYKKLQEENEKAEESLVRRREVALNEKNPLMTAEQFEADVKDPARALKQYAEEARNAEQSRMRAQKEYGQAFLSEIERLEQGVGGEDGRTELAVGWKSARNKALADHRELFYRGREKKMVDDASQRHVWDAKGINTPNNAEIAIYEALLKDFAAMDYNAAVAAVRDNMEVISKKIAAGKEISFEDGAITQALLKILHADSWIDDGILPAAGLAKLGVKVPAAVADKINERIRNDLEMIRGNRSTAQGGSSLGGSGGGSVPREQINAIADIMKQVLGDQAKELFSQLKLGNANSDKALLSAIQEGLKSASGSLQSDLIRRAGLAAGAPPAQLSAEIARLIQANKDRLGSLL